MTATPAASGSGTPSGRFRPLDGLRGLAALAVVAFHAGFAHAGGGAFGVDLFFVLSGYLITGLLLDEHGRRGTVHLLRFWGRRTMRLLPPLAAVLVAGVAMAGVMSPTGRAGGYYPDALIAGTWSMDVWSVLEPSRIAGNPLFFTWTLAIEEQFYLLWPIVLLMVLRRTALRRHATALLLTAGGLSWIDLALSWPASTHGVPGVVCRPDARSLPLLLGCALAVALSSDRPGRGVRTLASPTAAVVGLALTVSGIVVPGALGWTSPQRLVVPIGSLVTSLGGAVLLGHLVRRPRTWLATVLGSRPFVALGAISYSLYLAQIPAMRLLIAHDLLPSDALLRSMTGLGAALAGGIVLWAVVERPVLRRLRAPRAAASAVRPERPRPHLPPTRTRRRATAWAVAGLVPASFIAIGGAASAALARHDHRVGEPTAARASARPESPRGPASTSGVPAPRPETGRASGPAGRGAATPAGGPATGRRPAGSDVTHSAPVTAAPAGGTVPSLPVTTPSTPAITLPVTRPAPPRVSPPATPTPTLTATVPPPPLR